VISTSRQKLLVDFNLVPVVCAVLQRMFPFLHSLSAEQRYRLRLGELGEKGLGGERNKFEKSAKASQIYQQLLEKNLLGRVEISSGLYKLINCICYNNPQIQLVVSQRLPQLISDLVLVPSACECIQTTLHDNEEILMGYSKIKKHQIASPEPMASFIGQLPDADSQQLHSITREQESMGFEFFEQLCDVMKLYPRYTQSDVLTVLESLCVAKGRSFYLNQNTVFSLIRRPEIFGDKFIHTRKSKISEDREYFELVFLNSYNQQKSMALEELMSKQEFDPKKQFILAELSLFEVLCRNRNMSNIMYFREKFPIHLLTQYVRDNSTPDEFKSIFLKLVLTLYIDFAPRKMIELPSMVRIVAADGRSLLEQDLHLVDEIDQRFMEVKVDGVIVHQHQQAGNRMLSDIENEQLLIVQIREKLVAILESASKNLLTKDHKTSHFFNKFIKQVLNTLNKLLRFGTYDIFLSKNKKLAEENIQLIERIVNSLSTPFEYDHSYYEEMLSENNSIRFNFNNIDQRGERLPPKKTSHKKGIHNTINSSTLRSARRC